MPYTFLWRWAADLSGGKSKKVKKLLATVDRQPEVGLTLY